MTRPSLSSVTVPSDQASSYMNMEPLSDDSPNLRVISTLKIPQSLRRYRPDTSLTKKKKTFLKVSRGKKDGSTDKCACLQAWNLSLNPMNPCKKQAIAAHAYYPNNWKANQVDHMNPLASLQA